MGSRSCPRGNQIRITVVRPGRTNSVLMRNNFPELRATLIAALASLEMDELICMLDVTREALQRSVE